MIIIESSEANKTGHNVKPTLDIKRRSNIVDEAFLEQKEILLDMVRIFYESGNRIHSLLFLLFIFVCFMKIQWLVYD